MRDGSYTSPEILYTYTCTCVQCLVLAGVYISSLNVIMPFRQTWKLALEEDSRFGIFLWAFSLISRQAVKELLLPTQSNVTFICRKFCYVGDVEAFNTVFITKLELILHANWTSAIRGLKHEVQSLLIFFRALQVGLGKRRDMGGVGLHWCFLQLAGTARVSSLSCRFRGLLLSAGKQSRGEWVAVSEMERGILG